MNFIFRNKKIFIHHDENLQWTHHQLSIIRNFDEIIFVDFRLKHIEENNYDCNITQEFAYPSKLSQFHRWIGSIWKYSKNNF